MNPFEGIDPRLATARRRDRMAILAENIGHGFEQQWIIIDQQNTLAVPDRVRLSRRRVDHPARRRIHEYQTNRRPLSEVTVDFQIGTVALRNTIDHCEAQAGAPLTLGRIERLETAATR